MEAIKDAHLAPWIVLGAMLVILIILGCFIDQVSMMLICLPFFMPLVAAYGFDAVWFGVLFLICMQEIAMSQIWHAVTPYVVMGLIALALVIAFPPLATWLPKVLFR